MGRYVTPRAITVGLYVSCQHCLNPSLYFRPGGGIVKLTRHADGEVAWGAGVLCRVLALAQPVLDAEDYRNPIVA